MQPQKILESENLQQLLTHRHDAVLGAQIAQRPTSIPGRILGLLKARLIRLHPLIAHLERSFKVMGRQHGRFQIFPRVTAGPGLPTHNRMTRQDDNRRVDGNSLEQTGKEQYAVDTVGHAIGQAFAGCADASGFARFHLD